MSWTAIRARLEGWWREAWAAKDHIPFLNTLLADTAPLDLRIVGRMLWHAALVGVAAGLVGAAFFAALEYGQIFLLEGLAGYTPLRAAGEEFAARTHPTHFRPWVLVGLPALGGLLAGWLMRATPEARGGGGDATIDAFHRHAGELSPRIIWVKSLASLATLATGGAGGREGPTMQVGGALGSLVGRLLGVSARERRILLVAGIAAGIAAVFRTPLGAALLAVEVLYRDGFESDALIPSVMASVVAYSVIISIFGESTLFAHSPRYPFQPSHLPLYLLLALLVALAAAIFVRVLRATRRRFARVAVADWARPALGGALLGIFVTPIVMLFSRETGQVGQGLGLLGGGYGAVQLAITGASWLPGAWSGVLLLAGLAAAKIVASALTIGSGGSAGDFAPSLAIGGLLGGAFGRAMQLGLDPAIDPGAFALVGMGAFYGGIAHVPLAALVLVCEMAGNYDLLVPLMLAMAVSFVALRKVSLYESQAPTPRDSPVYRDSALLGLLRGLTVGDVMTGGRPYVTFDVKTPARELLTQAAEGDWQDVFPVREDGRIVGMITADALKVLAGELDATRWTIAADLMQPLIATTPDARLRVAAEQIVSHGLREILVLDPRGEVVGFLDEAKITEIYVRAARRAAEQRPGSTMEMSPLSQEGVGHLPKVEDLSDSRPGQG